MGGCAQAPPKPGKKGKKKGLQSNASRNSNPKHRGYDYLQDPLERRNAILAAAKAIEVQGQYFSHPCVVKKRRFSVKAFRRVEFKEAIIRHSR